MRASALPRLLANELRIEWRELTTQRGSGATWLLGAGLLVLLLAIWFWVLSGIRPLLQPVIASEAALLAGILLLGLLPFGIMMGINQSVKAIFERNDLDLLLSSPTPTSAVFASRLLSVATYVFVVLGIFLLPLAVVGLFTGIPRLLGAVPLLLAVALVSASLGMLVTLLLVRMFGARQARIISQILAAVSGVVLVLAVQIPALTSGPQNQVEQLTGFLALFQPGELLGPDSLVWFPGRTVFLHALPTVITLAASALLFAVAVAVLHRWFVLGASESTSAVRRRRATSTRGLQFARRASLWRVMLVKDWRVLIRDPYLISQSLLQLAYLLPLAIILFVDRSLLEQFSLGPIVATGLTVLAGTLASNLARICISGEEAVDLLVAAPVSPARLQIAKLFASVVPVWLLFVPMALALMFLDVAAGGLAAAAILISTVSVAFSRLNNPMRTRRQDLFNRKSQSDLWLILETFIPLAWGVAAWWLLAGNTNAWYAVIAGLLLPVIPWWRAQAVRYGFAAPAKN